MLSAHVVTSTGGDTEWADMRAAYDALDDATRERISTLSAYHSIRWSQAKAGYGAPANSYGYDSEDLPLRPLVKVHPVTGRPALFIGRHAHAIPGLDPAESEELLAGLLAFACRPPRTYRHTWTPGDVAVWDNRCVLHHACEYDYGQPRVMKHTRIHGEETERAEVLGYR
jgi:alpha-ketoglutarate-dependent taurine dioxygenase